MADQKFITITKAASILSCEADKIHDLCDQGLVRRHFEGDQVYVRHEDIAEIRRLDIVGEMKPGEMVRRLIMAEQEVRRLQASVKMLYEVMGLASSRFSDMSDDQLLSFYNMINDLLGEEIDNAQIDELAEALMKVTEVEVDRLNELLNLDNSWLPFLDLCTSLSRSIISKKELPTDINLQRTHAKIVMARKNLTTVGMFFIEKAGVLTPSRKLLAKVAAADMDAFDIIARKMKKEGKLKVAENLKGRKKNRELEK